MFGMRSTSRCVYNTSANDGAAGYHSAAASGQHRPFRKNNSRCAKAIYGAADAKGRNFGSPWYSEPSEARISNDIECGLRLDSRP